MPQSDNAKIRMPKRTGINRRTFLSASAASASFAMWPTISTANITTENRFVFILLRGGLDGLDTVIPSSDPNYAIHRRQLAIDTTKATRLDANFSLHPSLTHLADWYRSKDLLAIHAVGSGYRGRSHFDAQKALENGTTGPNGAKDGWLNRALGQVTSRRQSTTKSSGIAISQSLPLAMRGAYPVDTWSPSRLPELADDTLSRIARLYEPDAFFSSQLAQAIKTRDIAAGSMTKTDTRRQNWVTLARATGKFLQAEPGPAVAMLELNGWDTHANQAGSLGRRLGALDAGLAALQQGLADRWHQTTIVIATEFGRTVKINGTNGTDHGSASAVLLAGGAIAGGRVLGDFPGLSQTQLHEGRELKATTDLRAVIKGVIGPQLEISQRQLASDVFPNSANIKPMPDLLG